MWALLGGYIGAIILLQFCIGLVQKSPHIDGNNLSLATKKDLHLRRKIQHATTGLMILNATCFLSVEIAAGILFVFSGFFYFVYLLRCYSKRFDTIYLNHFQSIMREKEIKKQIVPSSFDFLIGNAIVLALFPKKIAQLAILHLSIGDPAASFCGLMYKRRWHSHQQRETTNKKSLAGFLGCWIVSSIASLLFLQLPLDQHSCMYACGIGLCGALAEFIYLGVDDNLSLPVLSAFFQTIMGRYLS